MDNFSMNTALRNTPSRLQNKTFFFLDVHIDSNQSLRSDCADCADCASFTLRRIPRVSFDPFSFRCRRVALQGEASAVLAMTFAFTFAFAWPLPILIIAWFGTDCSDHHHWSYRMRLAHCTLHRLFSNTTDARNALSIR